MNDLAEILNPASGSFVQRNPRNVTIATKCQKTQKSYVLSIQKVRPVVERRSLGDKLILGGIRVRIPQRHAADHHA